LRNLKKAGEFSEMFITREKEGQREGEGERERGAERERESFPSQKTELFSH